MGDANTPEIQGKRGFAGRFATLVRVTEAFGDTASEAGSVDEVIQGAVQAAYELTEAGDKDAPIAQELLKPAVDKSTNKPRIIPL